MSILDYFKPKKSAVKAKDRLQIIIAQQRTRETQRDFLPLMKQEILKVIEKYTNVSLNDIEMDLQTNDGDSVLELNIKLPDSVEELA